MIVSPRGTITADVARTAHPNIYLTSPQEEVAVAVDLRAAWGTLLTSARAGTDAQVRTVVAAVLRVYDCLPSQVADRLTR